MTKLYLILENINIINIIIIIKNIIKLEKLKNWYINVLIYRKNERIKIQTAQNLFCNATIEYKGEHQYVTPGYFLNENHSNKCDNLFNKKSNINKPLSEDINKDKDTFIEECNNKMEQSTIYYSR